MPDPDSIRLCLTIVAFAFLAAMIARPFFGLLSYLIIMMVRPGLFYPVLGDMRIELLVGLLILGVIFLSGRSVRVSFNDPICKSMFIVYGIMTISMLQAFDLKYSFDWMMEFAKIIAFSVMILALVETQRDIEIFLWFFSIVSCLLAYDAIFNYISGTIVKSVGDFRVDYAVTSGGMGSGHVALANMTLQAMPFLYYLSLSNGAGFRRWGGLCLFGLCLFAVVISGSRGGFIGLIALFLCITYFTKKKGLAVLIGAILFLSIPLFATSGYMNYMSSILTLGSSDESAGSRTTGLRHGFEMLIRRPLLGVGPGCYPLARQAWFGWGLWAHNHYGELMGDLGIIGTLVWYKFFKSYFDSCMQALHSLSTEPSIHNIFLALFVATIVRLVIGMGTHSVYIFFWYMVASVTAVQNHLSHDYETADDIPIGGKSPIAI